MTQDNWNNDWKVSEQQQRDIAIRHALTAAPKDLGELHKEADQLSHMLNGVDPQQAYYNQERSTMSAHFYDHYVMAQTLVHYPDSHLAQHYTAKYPEFAEQIGQAIEQHRAKQIGHDQGFGY